MSPTEAKFTGRTMCIQLSVAAMRWPDDMLDGVLTKDGFPLNAEAARKALHQLKHDGYDVVPCRHKCDEKGRCTGEAAS